MRLGTRMRRGRRKIKWEHRTERVGKHGGAENNA